MERFYFERPTAARKAEIIEYMHEFAAAGSEINGSGSLDRILSGWTFEQALDRCLCMEDKAYAEKAGRCPGKTFLLIRENDGRIIGTANVRWISKATWLLLLTRSLWQQTRIQARRYTFLRASSLLTATAPSALLPPCREPAGRIPTGEGAISTVT